MCKKIRPSGPKYQGTKPHEPSTPFALTKSLKISRKYLDSSQAYRDLYCPQMSHRIPQFSALETDHRILPKFPSSTQVRASFAACDHIHLFAVAVPVDSDTLHQCTMQQCIDSLYNRSRSVRLRICPQGLWLSQQTHNVLHRQFLERSDTVVAKCRNCPAL